MAEKQPLKITDRRRGSKGTMPSSMPSSMANTGGPAWTALGRPDAPAIPLQEDYRIAGMNPIQFEDHMPRSLRKDKA